MSIEIYAPRKPLDAIVETGEALKRELSGFRRWEMIATVQSLISHAQISAALADKAQTEAATWRSACQDHEMSTLALSAAREVLRRNGVPEAAFFDDCVANAIAQRNIMGRMVEEMVATLEAGLPGPETAAIIADIRARCARIGYPPKDEEPEAAQTTPGDP